MAEWHVATAHGRSLVAPDLATLHRWIIERRVTRDDRISQDGKTWQRVGEVADLVPFFDIVDSAERARRADTPGPLMLPAPPPYNSHPAPALGPVILDRGAFPEVEDRTETKLVRTGPARWALPLKLVLTTLVATLVAYAGIALHNLRRPARPATPPVAATGLPPTAATPAPLAEEPAAIPAIEPLAAEPEKPKPDDDAPTAAPASRKRARTAARAAPARASKPAVASRRTGAAPAAAATSAPAPQAVAAQGYAELNRRQFDKAIVHFKQALAGNPSNGTALFGLAEAYRETGQKALALKAYRHYVQLLPSGPDAGSARLQIRLLQGKR